MALLNAICVRQAIYIAMSRRDIHLVILETKWWNTFLDTTVTVNLSKLSRGFEPNHVKQNSQWIYPWHHRRDNFHTIRLMYFGTFNLVCSSYCFLISERSQIDQRRVRVPRCLYTVGIKYNYIKQIGKMKMPEGEKIREHIMPISL